MGGPNEDPPIPVKKLLGNRSQALHHKVWWERQQHQLKQERARLDTGKFFSTRRTVQQWDTSTRRAAQGLPRPNMEGPGLPPELTLLRPGSRIQTSSNPFPPQLPHDPASTRTSTLAPRARTSSPTSPVPHYEAVRDPRPWHLPRHAPCCGCNQKDNLVLMGKKTQLEDVC